MQARFPLYAKILAWFFLNLLLLFAMGWMTLRLQARSSFDSFLTGYAGDRVEPLGRTIMDALSAMPKERWDAALKEYSELHKVEFFLFGLGQSQLAGTTVELPSEVSRHMPRGGRPRPERPPEQGETVAPKDGERPPPKKEKGEKGKGPPPVHGRFLVRSEEPRSYWLGLIMAMPSSERTGPSPAVLLIRSPTFSAGGLFFDSTPWLLAGGGVIVISVLFWFPLVRSITRSISQITTVAGQVSDGRFDVRVDEKRADELGQLGGAINRMTDRLGGLVTGQKRFLGDIAHELCSPIARLQMALGILEQRADEKQKPYLEDVREEVQHMSDLVNELLSFSKASLKPGNIKLQSVSIKEIAEQAAGREAAGKSDVVINVPETLTAIANAELLQRAISNLVRNALRYAGHAGPITISAERKDDRVHIIVADNGPGIPEEHLQRVFDTFYRIDLARDRESGGVGLGLTIVRTCIETCGGSVSCRNREPRGLEVIIKLNAE